MSSLIMFGHHVQLLEKNTVSGMELTHQPHLIKILVL